MTPDERRELRLPAMVMLASMIVTAALAVCGALLLLAGCASPTTPEPDTTGPAQRPGQVLSTSPGGTADVDLEHKLDQAADGPATPAPITSGELDASDLPEKLPGGYVPAVADGGAEAGFNGNGTPVRVKDPGTALDPLRLLCGDGVFDTDLRPVAALQGLYRQPTRGQTANVLLLEFSNPDQTGRTAAGARDCVAGPYRLVVKESGRRVQLTAFPANTHAGSDVQ